MNGVSTIMDKSIVISDNFSFQNNGIKKVHMLENNGFFGKQCCFFFKAMVFLHDFTHGLF